MKLCQICGTEILKREGRSGGWKKHCSYECAKENNRRWLEKISKKKCKLCKQDFEIINRMKPQRKYCYGCTNKAKSLTKKAEKNPNWIGGKAFHKKPKYSLRMRRHNFVCQQFRKVFIEEHGYPFCEVCKISNEIKAFKFETHHIYYVSHHPKNENLHHPKNLIFICRSCHKKFHGGEYKKIFAEIEKDRGLKELFAKGRTVKDPPVFNYRVRTK